MRLADFILLNMEAILAEWESFASTLLPASTGMTSLALRDHAPQILQAIAKDLGTSQSRDEQWEKSRGRAPKLDGAPATAAQSHAVLRARGGFDINQLVSEYRAMRTSVLRLWTDTAAPTTTTLDDVIRFNEAIDQAIAESVREFHAHVEQARNLLLGMLGHDMRSPLMTILTTATHLSELNAGEQITAAAASLVRSGASMQALLDDLVDFNRTKLGLGIRVVAAPVNLAVPVADEVEQLRCAHPDCSIELTVTGDCSGHWDGVRLQQALRHLVSNAIVYGTPHTPVGVALRSDDRIVRMEVTNRGRPIDSSLSHQIFDPLRRGATPGGIDRSAGLGLGLYVVREIARAHGGEVDVYSRDGQTTFAIELPRNAPSTAH